MRNAQLILAWSSQARESLAPSRCLLTKASKSAGAIRMALRTRKCGRSPLSLLRRTPARRTRSRYVTPKLRGQRRRQPRTSIALCPTMPMTRRSSLPTLPSRKARTRSRSSGQASWGLRVLDLVGNHHCGRGEERAEPRGRWRVGAPRRARRSLPGRGFSKDYCDELFVYSSIASS